MKNRVLVAYASKYGATVEIAAKIAAVLEEAHLVVSLLPADQAVEISDYQAVVVGSPIYVGRWRPEAVSFLEKFESQLAKRQVWLFSSGPTGRGEPEDILDGWYFPREQQELAERIMPQDIKLFHGAIDLNKLSDLELNTIKHIKAEIGDFRDWLVITAWAEHIASCLAK